MSMIDPNWTISEKEIKRQFDFTSFKDAIAFMLRISFEAEKLDHHPDWSNSYNIVSVSLSTHSAGKVTEKDYELARIMDEIYSQYSCQ